MTNIPLILINDPDDSVSLENDNDDSRDRINRSVISAHGIITIFFLFLVQCPPTFTGNCQQAK